ncbi:MAG: protein ndvB [Rhizobiaceae bacterium]|nr:protein ndvB [Rhizobiaceae bacterium]MCV0406858.1 protein ndvB [Rhizobiaceae bacterium]
MNVQTSPDRLKASRPGAPDQARPQPAEQPRQREARHHLPPKADEPIRGPFLPVDRLKALGAKIGLEEACGEPGLRPFDPQARNRDNAGSISAVYHATNRAQAMGESITPAAQWLLDNHYLVEETIHQIRRDLPRRFYRQLPLIDGPDGQKVPRALALAWAYVAHTDSAFSQETFAAIVEGYQMVHPLKIGELWALPSLLRFVLVENLRRLALRVDRSRRMRNIANDVADRVLAEDRYDERARILDDYVPHTGDSAFATQLLYRLRDGSQNAGRALEWLERELEKEGGDAELATMAEHQTQSSGNVTTGNIIRGLRAINDAEWTEWFERISRVDALLRERSNFAALDFPSRDYYRTEIEDLALRSRHGEVEVTQRALEMAEATPEGGDADVGFLLVGSRRRELEKAIGFKPGPGRRFYRAYRRLGWLAVAAPIAAITLIFLLIAGVAFRASDLSGWTIAAMLLLFALPAAEGATGLFNTIVMLFLKPSKLVGYEFADGLPAEARTLVVMPTLIGSRDDVEEAVRNIEVHHLANIRGAIHYAILSDWPDSPVEQTEADLELLDFARERIAELNSRHPGDSGFARFHLLHRRRLWNDCEGSWMGWERKRGKLHELNLILRGDSDTTFLPPDSPLPEGVVHVMTLDADTRMTRDAVVRLAGKICHPLNRPRIDPVRRRVTGGYTILQPRVTASLTTGDEASFFQRVFSSNRGLDPYVFTVSDVYQDIFGDGTFTGKGLYHVDAMEAALAGRIAENTVLSHDLLEGALSRAALVTDVELVEDYPTRYAVDASRQHRWTRGDWQLLPIIFERSMGIPPLSRWKMLDNLRRSLTPVFWVGASIAGWTLLPFPESAIWQFFLILSLFVAPTFDILASIVPRSREITPRGHVFAFLRDVAIGTAQVVVRIVLIAHNAWLMGDAIARTLYRVYVSRRRLLEWRTASQATKGSVNSIEGYYKMMWGSPAIAAIGVAIPLAAGSESILAALVFGIVWAAAPAFAWIISRSAVTEERLVVTEEETALLRTHARRTWLYFETFVTEEHNHLPPDNFQETPQPVVAARTSPTNIGVYLLSIVSARDFGWIALGEAIDRLEKTVSTLETMQKHRGHLYNWYETRTLNPLLPLYVSSVDSGNLAGHLIAVAAACNEWRQAPAAYLEGSFDGILDPVWILDECLSALPDDRRSLRPLRRRLQERIDGARRAVETMKREPELAAVRAINLAVLATEIRKLAASIHHETKSIRSEELALWAQKLHETCEHHVSDAHTDEALVEAYRDRLAELRERARGLAFQMDFSFLLRADRRLLSIGYRMQDNQLDEACYDLLASEARLASLFAIAKGDIPTEHWMRLGRPIVEIGFQGALVSWSGSMFEYLMPPLVMKEPLGGILNQTSNLIIKRQIRYGRSRGVPWGVSEAAYNARDHEMTYQYTNFGVPGLGLKRGLAHNLVIAPYATMLAAQFKPREAVENLRELVKLGALGRYGFHDAVDFTPQRMPEGQRHAVVRNYMAHHQGMTVVAVGNVMFEGRMRDRFHSDAVIEAAELLLQEKAPRDIPAAAIRSADIEPGKGDGLSDQPGTRLIVDPARTARATLMMSNGRWSMMLTSRGTGYARLGETAVTRWTPDPTEDRAGIFLFVRDVETGEWWSATTEPKQAEDEIASTHLSDDKATFIKSVGSLRSEVECIAVSEGDGEARRITLFNEGTSDRHVDVTSYGEIVLYPEASDQAHPAFAKMFVSTEIAPGNRAIFAKRRKRSKGEAELGLVHFITEGGAPGRETEAETDRRAFIGRGRDLSDAAAFDKGQRLGASQGFTLDPIFSLRRQVRVPAGKKVSLTFWTLVSADRAELEEAVDRLDYPESFQRQAMMAWTRSQVQTRHVGLSLADAANVQKLARYLLYPDISLRQPSAMIASGLGSQSALWPMAISGDFPIFALRIGDQADIEIVASALRYQEYLRARGLMADLVIVNEQASSYVQDLQQAIEWLCDNSRLRGRELGPRQHIFAVRRDLMDERSYTTLLGCARIVLHTRNGTIFDQIERAESVELSSATGTKALPPTPKARRVSRRQPPASPRGAAPQGDGLDFWNGRGGFADGGAEYVVRLRGGEATPQPWINVIANPSFGFHVSAEGAAFTWSRNSRDFQITPWSNDPVRNRPGEGFYVVDRDSGAAMSPFAALLSSPATAFEARHGQGYSVFSARHGELALEATMVVDAADPVKVTRLRVTNDGAGTRRLRVYGYAEWVLGSSRARTAPTIVPEREPRSGALTARNPYGLDFPDRTAFLATDADAQSFTADRAELIGDGSSERPATVLAGAALSGNVEAGRDPCAAIARDIEVAPGETVETFWLLGDAGSTAEAGDLVLAHRQKPFDERLAEAKAEWSSFLGTVQIETPDAAMNAVVNRWLPYQAVACRVRARSAFYQASGAFGFRDQLQDTLALLLHDPSLARAQILNAASRQFREGDVQHWWLPRTGAGVRTMISDDVVWLGHGLAHYLGVTGDDAILDEKVPFLEGEALREGEHDSFFTPELSKETATVWEHAARALDLVVRRTGENGLPLILGGDWNDGMNAVGEEGRGTSVWLGWFLARTIADLAPLARKRGEKERAAAWEAHREKLLAALEGPGWDGDWYLRGTYDDGSPLGGKASDECRIDSLAQSWSVLSGAGDPKRAKRAMDAAIEHLADEDHHIVRLFTPPFENTAKEPGYIKSYPPGVRENGGQYTHAATWFVLALAELGRADEAWRYFSWLNPVNHALDAGASERYRVEPYVVAADIYSEGEKAGRGGWTWYTGSAGWLYRAAIEGILGIRKKGSTITVEPAIPSDWDGFSATLRIGDATHRLRVERVAGLKRTETIVDGKTRKGGTFDLRDSGEHDVVIRLPR